MNITPIKLSLKTGVLSIVIILSLILYIIAIILIRFLSYGYTNLVIDESSEILNQYTEKVENNLKQTEKLSYDILCSPELQSNMLLYLNSEGTYDKYLATTSIHSQLFNRVFSEPLIVSADFIFGDSTRVDVETRTTKRQKRDYMDYIYKKAVAANGNAVWTVNPNDTSIISSSRLIKDSAGTNGFMSLGVLVINLDAEKLLTYDAVSSPKYKSDIICYANGTTLSYKDLNLSDKDISSIIEKNKQSGETTLNNNKYLFFIKNSSTTNWQFISILQSNNLFSYLNNLQTLYLVSFMLVVIFIVFLAMRFADKICYPVVALSRSMIKVKEDIFEKQPQTNKQHLQIDEIIQLTGSYNTMISKIDYLINEVYKKQLMISDMHYKMLQHQINPHFLYNTLETIRWKAEECGNTDISIMAVSISNILRTSINKVDIYTVHDDLKLIRDYISIQLMRFEERLVFELEPDFSLFPYKIPKMTIQPIIENSIRHNLEKHSGVCKIHVSFEKHENNFSIFVSDNGKDVDIDRINQIIQGQAVPTGTGLGLKNISERIQICFGNDYGIQIHSKSGGGLCVEILLPYKLD